MYKFLIVEIEAILIIVEHYGVEELVIWLLVFQIGISFLCLRLGREVDVLNVGFKFKFVNLLLNVEGLKYV